MVGCSQRRPVVVASADYEGFVMGSVAVRQVSLQVLPFFLSLFRQHIISSEVWTAVPLSPLKKFSFTLHQN